MPRKYTKAAPVEPVRVKRKYTKRPKPVLEHAPVWPKGVPTRDMTMDEVVASIHTATGRPPVDLINHPPHYTAGGIEVIDFIEAKTLNYALGQVVKYVSRADLKGDPIKDLKKALWYLNREIGNRESGQ